MKTKKIPFNLERWQSGDFVRVETKKGLEVHQLVYFNRAKSPYVLYGVLGDDIATWTIDGVYIDDGLTHQEDIFIIVKRKEEQTDKDKLLATIEKLKALIEKL